MIRTSQVMALMSLLLALSACGSSPPVHYYSLDAIEKSYQTDADNALAMGLGPLRMPEYLSRSRIVTRGSNSEVLVDDFNRWAEPVDDAMHRIVAANVDSLLDGVVVIAFPYSHVAELDYQLIGRIDEFHSDQGGRVVLLVQWGILAPDSDFVVHPRRVRYETQASDPGDHGSIARAMSEAIAEFSRDIASEFEAAVP